MVVEKQQEQLCGVDVEEGRKERGGRCLRSRDSTSSTSSSGNPQNQPERTLNAAVGDESRTSNAMWERKENIVRDCGRRKEVGDQGRWETKGGRRIQCGSERR